MSLTLERLKARLIYNPETGIFVWTETFSGTCRQGWPAGRMGTGKSANYLRITVDGREYRAHRLAWLWMTGEWPISQIDHINGRGDDNRWSNLRSATQSQNKANSPVYRNSKSGIKGISWNASSRKWNASIQVNKKLIHLGRFADINDAAKAYKLAAEKYFGSFSRTS